MELRRPFLCMTCGYAGCLFKDPVRDAQLPVTQGSSGASDGAEEGTSHIGLHLAEEAHPYGTSQSHLHVAACDIVHGTFFCSACDDIVYDARFDHVLQRETHRAHVPSAREHALDALMIMNHPSSSSAEPPSTSICPMPRGLRNMGATCFLNVILQSFLHNPLLRNHFLSDRHNAALCAAGRDCLACEMDKLFKEVCWRTRTR